MANYRAYAQFTTDKIGKTGLSDVTIVAYDGMTGNAITTSGNATHLGKGIYQYTIQSATEIEPVGVFVTADTTVDQQEVPFLVTKEIVHGSQTGEYTTALTAIQADLDNPAQYKADISGLALETTAQAIKAKTDGIVTPPTTTQIADAVWTRSARTVTNTIPSAATIASTVWGNATRTLTTAFPTPPTPAAIATAVWAETVRTLTSYPTQLTQADIRAAVGQILTLNLRDLGQRLTTCQRRTMQALRGSRQRLTNSPILRAKSMPTPLSIRLDWQRKPL